MSTSELLPIAHLALSAVFLLWNILLAGRITGQRALPRFLAGLTALGGLLIAPALLVLVASTSLITGRSVSTIGWIWPVTATLIAAQAFYAMTARLVTPLIGVPILLYDLVAAGTALGSYLVAEGGERGEQRRKRTLAGDTPGEEDVPEKEHRRQREVRDRQQLREAHPRVRVSLRISVASTRRAKTSSALRASCVASASTSRSMSWRSGKVCTEM